MAVEELFAGVRSVALEETVTVLVKRPSMKGCRTRLMVAVWLLGIVPRLHVTTPLSAEHEPCEGKAVTYPALRGTALVTTTLAAAVGPRLVTVMVNVQLLVTMTCPVGATLVTVRSASAFTVVTAEAALLAGTGS